MTVKLVLENTHGICSLDRYESGESRAHTLGTLPDLDHGVCLVPLPQFAENRGTLLPFDFEKMPFRPRRVFVVNNVPAGTVRGQHAHRRGQQLLVRLAGEIRVELRAGGHSETVSLARSDVGLLVRAGVWAAQTYVTSAAVLLVLCSEPYDASSYVDTKSV